MREEESSQGGELCESRVTVIALSRLCQAFLKRQGKQWWSHTWGTRLSRGHKAVTPLAWRREGLVPAVILAAVVAAAGEGNALLQL